MKKGILLTAIIVLFCSFCVASQSAYKMVTYSPMSQAECQKHKNHLGLKYCPHDNDHLAGAALACGHIKNLPSKNELYNLAKKVYNKKTDNISIYGDRNDEMLKNMGIFVNDSHIFYWIGEEAEDGKGGYVRMFASKGSLIYYAPRDGKGYKSSALGMIKYGHTRSISTRPEHDSNLVGLPNNDALVCICSTNRNKVNPNKYNLDTFGKIMRFN